jgi:hypothetical protein
VAGIETEGPASRLRDLHGSNYQTVNVKFSNRGHPLIQKGPAIKNSDGNGPAPGRQMPALEKEAPAAKPGPESTHGPSSELILAWAIYTTAVSGLLKLGHRLILIRTQGLKYGYYRMAQFYISSLPSDGDVRRCEQSQRHRERITITGSTESGDCADRGSIKASAPSRRSENRCEEREGRQRTVNRIKVGFPGMLLG